MSDINLNFDLSNTVQQFEINPVAANIQLDPIDLNITTAPLAITVEGTGAFYTRAVNNSDRAYTSSNVVVVVPQQTINITSPSFAVAEYTLSGITGNSNGGTPSTLTLSFTGNTGNQGTIPTQAYATFATTGVTPVQTNSDATPANNLQTFSGVSSNNVGGNNTLFYVDIPNNANAGSGTTYSMTISSYGGYPTSFPTTPITSNSNSLQIIQQIQTTLEQNRYTFTFSNTSYVSPIPTTTTIVSVSNTILGYADAGTASGGSGNYLYLTANISNSNVANINFVGSSNVSYQLYANSLNFYYASEIAKTPSNALGTIRVTGSNTTQVYTTTSATPTSLANWTISNVSSRSSLTSLYAAGNTFVLCSQLSSGANTFPTIYIAAAPYNTWTSYALTTNAVANNTNITAFAYDGSLFYAFTDNRYLYTSATLTGTWTQSNLQSVNNNVIYKAAVTNNGSSNVQVVAVGQNGSIMTKPVGNSTTWTIRTPPGTFDTAYSVATDTSNRVIAIDSLGSVKTSFDHGNTWANGNSSSSSIVEYLGSNVFVYYGVSTLSSARFTTYNRLIVDTHYGATGAQIIGGVATSTGTNVAPLFSTRAGTTGTQGQDVLRFNDGANIATYTMAYGLSAYTLLQDITARWGATANWVPGTLTPDGSGGGNVIFTARTPGLISNSAQLTANYTYGNGGSIGNFTISRTSQYNGSNNTTNPQPIMSIDANGVISNVNLPYNTNLANFFGYSNLISVPGWVDTQTTIGNFTLTANTPGTVSNVWLTFSNAGGASFTRTAYDDGTGTVPDTAQPYVEISFDNTKVYQPNPYRFYLPWAANAGSLANSMRNSGSMTGITFSGTGSNVILTSTFNGSTTTPTVVTGGNGISNLTVANSFVNGTGDVPWQITIDSTNFEIPFNANPGNTITQLINSFYSDDWRIARTGTNQFSLIANQLGPKTQPNISIAAGSPANAYQTISNTVYTQGSNTSVTVPQQSINLGILSVVLPGITLQI